MLLSFTFKRFLLGFENSWTTIDFGLQIAEMFSQAMTFSEDIGEEGHLRLLYPCILQRRGNVGHAAVTVQGKRLQLALEL
jgi:hypothetical protein